MTITEFCQSRNIDRNTVSMYMSRHKKQFQGHKKTVGKNVLLDEVAIEILSEKYPLPEVIEVVNTDQVLKDKIIQLQELVMTLQNKLLENQEKVALAEAEHLLLQDRETLIVELKSELEEERAATHAANQKIDELLQRNLWERVRNKT